MNQAGTPCLTVSELASVVFANGGSPSCDGGAAIASSVGAVAVGALDDGATGSTVAVAVAVAVGVAVLVGSVGADGGVLVEVPVEVLVEPVEPELPPLLVDVCDGAPCEPELWWVLCNVAPPEWVPPLEWPPLLE
jgi:hypothetical protein